MDEQHIIHGLVFLLKKAQTELPSDVVTALKQAYKQESGIAKIQLETILKNIALAKKNECPLCQDTGMHTFFITIGYESPYIKHLKKLISTAVKKATKEIPLRPNTVDPITGKNHNDNLGGNAPSIIWDFTDGSDVDITVLPKGNGSENMSALAMLNPSDGIDGAMDFVVETVKKAGGNPCPPIIVGVGIGGTADLVMSLGKHALLRPVGARNSNPKIASLEKQLIKNLNKLGIGPMGLGGKTTALDVHIETAYRHPASFPVGVVVQCWANRRGHMILHADGNWEVK
jgi:fumarate hydratase subunit alpha